MSVYFFAWVASVAYGLEGILAKITSRHSVKNPWLFTFLWQLFVLVGTAVLAFYYGAGIPAHWFYIILASLAYTLTGVFFTLSLYRLDVSVIAPLTNFRTPIAVLAGAIFLGEILTYNQYLMILLIFTCGIFASLDENFNIKSFFNRGTGLAVLAMVFSLLLSLFIKKAVVDTNFWNTSLWTALLGQIWLCATIPLFKSEFRKLNGKQYGIIGATALIGTVGTLCANAAFAINVSIATTIISLPVSMFIVFLSSFFFPELIEKHALKVYIVRFIAAAVMIFAALKL
jgi:uncharacterized membrane protein